MAATYSLPQKPVFSVILTTFNRASLLRRAITSILQQTFSAFELIIVDDASMDATSKVVAAIADSRIRYLRQSTNGGVGQARNLGIGSANGKYIAFVDDDDTIAPSFLAEVYAAFSQAPSTVGFLWTWKEVVRQTDTSIQKFKQLTYGSTTDAPRSGVNLLRKLSGGSGGLVVRADALQVTGGFNAELRAVGDFELLVRLASSFDYLIIPQYLYRIFADHGSRLTAPSLMRAHAYERIIEVHFDLLRQYPSTLRVLYLGCARMHYQVGDRDKARHFMNKLVKFEPLNWKNWMLFLLLENLDRLPPFVSRRIIKNNYRDN